MKYFYSLLLVLCTSTIILMSSTTEMSTSPAVEIKYTATTDTIQVKSPKLHHRASKLQYEYIQKYRVLARQHESKFGIPSSIKMAQALLESRAGTSTAAMKANNHFGVKCFTRNCGINLTDDTKSDQFKYYYSPESSWYAHSILLNNSRYIKLHQYGNDYKKWAHGLKECGYATDKRYAEKLIYLIEYLELHLI